MPDFRIRLEFDVEIDNPSHIDAAFAAAEVLAQWAAADRLDYLIYDVAPHAEPLPFDFKTVDLAIIQADSDA